MKRLAVKVCDTQGRLRFRLSHSKGLKLALTRTWKTVHSRGKELGFGQDGTFTSHSGGTSLTRDNEESLSVRSPGTTETRTAEASSGLEAQTRLGLGARLRLWPKRASKSPEVRNMP